MVLTMETQCSPEGFPRISMVPPLADPCPSHPQEGIRKEERGKGGPHRKEKGMKMKKSTEKQHPIATGKMGGRPLAIWLCRGGRQVGRRLG